VRWRKLIAGLGLAILALLAGRSLGHLWHDHEDFHVLLKWAIEQKKKELGR